MAELSSLKTVPGSVFYGVHTVTCSAVQYPVEELEIISPLKTVPQLTNLGLQLLQQHSI